MLKKVKNFPRGWGFSPNFSRGGAFLQIFPPGGRDLTSRKKCPGVCPGGCSRLELIDALFSHKYDVTDTIRQDDEKMKVQYLRNLLFDWFKFCRLLELSKGISLDFKFRCYANQNQDNCLLLKNKRSIV